MTDRTWHKGPPPHVGWWETIIFNQPIVYPAWRWWNGNRWSVCVEDWAPIKSVAFLARTPSGYSKTKIQWSDYYPPNARVPRVNPNITGFGAIVGTYGKVAKWPKL